MVKRIRTVTTKVACLLFFGQAALVFYGLTSFCAAEAVSPAVKDVPGAIAPVRELVPEEKITPEELRALQLKRAGILLFDARDDRAYDAEHIEGAVLPLPKEYYRQRELFMARVVSESPNLGFALTESMKNYPRDKVIVTYCNHDCKASAFLLLQLQALGFKNVRAMEAGIGAWKEKGYPVTAGVPKVSGLPPQFR